MYLSPLPAGMRLSTRRYPSTAFFIWPSLSYRLHDARIRSMFPGSALMAATRRKDKDSFTGQQEFVVGYSKASEQLHSSARPVSHSHTMTSTGHEPATIRIAAYRSSPRYALHHGRRQYNRSLYPWWMQPINKLVSSLLAFISVAQDNLVEAPVMKYE